MQLGDDLALMAVYYLLLADNRKDTAYQVISMFSNLPLLLQRTDVP